MASKHCWRCLQRPSAPASRHVVPSITAASTTATASFSTTSAQQAVSVTKEGQKGKRMNLSRYKKKRDQIKVKSPMPGERKDFRKRIQLSNTNAIPVTGLDVLTVQNMTHSASVGKVFGLEGTLEELKASEAFKATQYWKLFYRPHVLWRAESVELMTRMQRAAKNKEALRLVVTGDKLSGKSILLLQAMASAFINRWIVINIPEAQELTTACTEYAAIPGSNPVQWQQHIYAFKWMQAIRTANLNILSRLRTTKPYTDFTNPVYEGSSLASLIESAREADQAWPVFTALCAELLVKGRPPLLFTLDNLTFIMKISDYRNPAFELIHSHDLVIVRMFVDMLSGKTPLPNGGAIIAATSRGNAPRNASMELAIDQRLAEQEKLEVIPQADPFSKKYDARVDEAMKSVEVLKLKGISKLEARALMEYWAASGVLRATINEHTISEKWMTGGNGIIGEMERAGLVRTLRL